MIFQFKKNTGFWKNRTSLIAITSHQIAIANKLFKQRLRLIKKMYFFIDLVSIMLKTLDLYSFIQHSEFELFEYKALKKKCG